MNFYFFVFEYIMRSITIHIYLGVHKFDSPVLHSSTPFTLRSTSGLPVEATSMRSMRFPAWRLPFRYRWRVDLHHCLVMTQRTRGQNTSASRGRRSWARCLRTSSPAGKGAFLQGRPLPPLSNAYERQHVAFNANWTFLRFKWRSSYVLHRLLALKATENWTLRHDSICSLFKCAHYIEVAEMGREYSTHG
jgi:hypothetical protein